MAKKINSTVIKAFGGYRKTPRVSIIVVNYNAGSTLSKCIHHVLASTVDTDIIIVDNASSDASISEAMRNFGHVDALSIYHLEENVGFSRANNFTYPLVESDYILYLNPDCFIQRDTIQNMLELMDAHPDCGMSGCLIINEDGSEQRGCRGLTPTPWRSMMQILQLAQYFPKIELFSGYTLNHLPLPTEPISVELISGAFMFTRRSAIAEVGLLDEHYFLYCEDYDWFYRFREKDWDILFSPHSFAMHLKGVCGRRVSRKILWHKTRGMLHYHQKFFQKNSFFLKNWFIKSMIISRFFILLSSSLLKR